MSKFKSNLQEMRKRAGFKSAKEFAEFAGVNYKTYTNHEQGDSQMSLLQAWVYADLLNCTLDELAGRKVESLTNNERHIVTIYRDADARGRRTIDRAVNGVAEDMEFDAREKKEAI